MQEILLKIRYFEREISKSLQKVNFIFSFWTQSLLMEKVIKNKRGLELVTGCSSGYETSSEKFLYSLYITWPKLMINVKQFLSYSKHYICEFLQANSWHKLFHFHLFIWIWKVRKGSEKITKIWIFRERKELFRWHEKRLLWFLKG